MGSIVEKRVNDFLVNEVVLFVFADQTQFVEFAQNFKHDSPSLPQTVAHRRNQQAVDYHAQSLNPLVGNGVALDARPFVDYFKHHFDLQS